MGGGGGGGRKKKEKKKIRHPGLLFPFITCSGSWFCPSTSILLLLLVFLSDLHAGKVSVHVRLGLGVVESLAHGSEQFAQTLNILRHRILNEERQREREREREQRKKEKEEEEEEEEEEEKGSQGERVMQLSALFHLFLFLSPLPRTHTLSLSLSLSFSLLFLSPLSLARYLDAGDEALDALVEDFLGEQVELAELADEFDVAQHLAAGQVLVLEQRSQLLLRGSLPVGHGLGQLARLGAVFKLILEQDRERERGGVSW